MRFTLLALIATLACASPTVPAGDPDYIGAIVEVRPDAVWVRAEGEECGVRARLSAESYLEIDGVSAVSLDAGVGRTARVWFTNTLLQDSCPRGVGGRAIVVD